MSDSEDDDDVVNISEVDSPEQFAEMSVGASKDETLRRRAAMQQIRDTLAEGEATTSQASGISSSTNLTRRNTEVVEGDLAFRDSASIAMLRDASSANSNNIDDNGAIDASARPPPMPPRTESVNKTLRIPEVVVGASGGGGDDVLDLSHPADRGAAEPVPVVAASLRWRKNERRVRLSTALSVADVIGAFVERVGADLPKRPSADALALARRRHGGGASFDVLERSALVGALALSDAELVIGVRKCDECRKERVAACVTQTKADGGGARLFLCRVCATVAGVKQLKVQQMLLVGQIGELELKLKRATSSAQTKKLSEALRLAKARHRGIVDDIAALTPDLPKTTTVPLQPLKRTSDAT